MNALTEFKFHTHAVRVFPTGDGLSFFAVAADVASALGYAKTSDFIRNIPDRHKGAQKVRTLGGVQEMAVIDEPGLYYGLLRSNKPEAEPFVAWVTEDVLPSIRRTGSYQPSESKADLPAMLTPEQYEAEKARLAELQARLSAAQIVLSGEQYEHLTEQRLQVGKKVHIVSDLIGILESLGVPREIARELTGHNSNAVRQFAHRSRKQDH